MLEVYDIEETKVEKACVSIRCFIKKLLKRRI